MGVQCFDELVGILGQIYHYNNYNGGIPDFEFFEHFQEIKDELEATENVSTRCGAGAVPETTV